MSLQWRNGSEEETPGPSQREVRGGNGASMGHRPKERQSVVLRAQMWFRSLRLATDGTRERAGTSSIILPPHLRYVDRGGVGIVHGV